MERTKLTKKNFVILENKKRKIKNPGKGDLITYGEDFSIRHVFCSDEASLVYRSKLIRICIRIRIRRRVYETVDEKGYDGEEEEDEEEED